MPGSHPCALTYVPILALTLALGLTYCLTRFAHQLGMSPASNVPLNVSFFSLGTPLRRLPPTFPSILQSTLTLTSDSSTATTFPGGDSLRALRLLLALQRSHGHAGA